MRRPLITALALACALGVSLRAAHAQSMSASPSMSAARDTARDTAPLPRGMRRVTWPVALKRFVTGDTVRAADIGMLDTTIVWKWSSSPDSLRDVAGWIVRRPVAVGEVLRVPAVMPPSAVTAGSTVTAIWQDGALRLVLTGVAVNTAPLGANVGVRIDRSRRLDGIAVAPNTVRLR